jgi:hypothetical protein
MFRTFSIVIVPAATIALPAIAQTTIVQPSSHPSTPAKTIKIPLTFTSEQTKLSIERLFYSQLSTKTKEFIIHLFGKDGTVIETDADLDGFLGMGETVSI